MLGSPARTNTTSEPKRLPETPGPSPAGASLNIPTAITLSRMLLAGVVVWALFRGDPASALVALVTFVLAALTDYWDGEVARRTGQITRLGAILDPIADKVLTLSCFAAFWFLALIPGWTVLVLALRDTAVTLVRLAPDADHRSDVRRSGKNKTFLQLAYIFIVILHIWGRQGLSEVWPERAAVDAIYGGMHLIVLLTVWSGLRVLLNAGARRRVPS